MYQLGWTTVLRYFTKYYSGCFWGSVVFFVSFCFVFCWVRLPFRSVEYKLNRLASGRWTRSKPSVKGLQGTETELPPVTWEGILPADGVWAWTAAGQSLQPVPPHCRFWTCLSSNWMSQFLEIIFLCMYTSYWFSFSIEPQLPQSGIST